MPNINGIKYSVTSPSGRNTRSFILGIQDSQKKYSQKFDDLLDAAAKESERYLKRSLPKSPIPNAVISPSAAVQTPRIRIRDSVTIEKKPYRAGGSGGGVAKSRKISVGKGVPYFKDVMFGTGIYSTKGPKRRIQYPHGASYAPYADMANYQYDKMGNPNKLFSNKMPGSYSKAKSLRKYEVIIYSSRGQKPRFEIIQRSRDRTEAFIKAGLRSIDL